jgi:hypothetical protein
MAGVGVYSRWASMKSGRSEGFGHLLLRPYDDILAYKQDLTFMNEYDSN